MCDLALQPMPQGAHIIPHLPDKTKWNTLIVLHYRIKLASAIVIRQTTLVLNH